MPNSEPDSTSVRARIFRGLAASSYGRAVLVIGQVLLVPILVTNWTAVGYGEWITLSAVAAYLGYANLGMPGALRAYMAMAYSRGGLDAMRTAFQTSFALIASVSLAGLAAFVAAVQLLPISSWLHLQWMSDAEAKWVVCALAGQLALYAICSVPSSALSSIGRYAQASLFDAHRQTAEFILVLVLVGVWHRSPVTAAMIYVVTWGLFGLATLAALVRHAAWLFAGPPSFQPSILRELAKPMIGILGMTFGYVGMSVQAPRVILAATVGPGAVAVYSLAGMMMRIVRIPIDIPAHSATVEVSLAVGLGEISRARKMVELTTTICFWLAVTLVPLVIFAGPWIAHLWSNSRVAVPRELLVIMAVSTLFFSLALPCQEALMAVNRLIRTTGWLIASAPPFLVLCWFCSRSMGVNGAALSVVFLDVIYAVLAMSTAAGFLGARTSEMYAVLLRPPIGALRKELRALAGR